MTAMDLIKRLDGWFAERLEGLQCTPDTRAYVIGVLGKKRWDGDILVGESIVLAFNDALITSDFAAFQRIGDWVLWIDSVYPEYINDHRDVIESIGRRSYYSCHRIMRGQWRVYEELADELPSIAAKVHRKIV
jgi:hypothetical protein